MARLLQKEMKNHGLPTYTALSRLAGIPPESISRWVHGRTRPQVASLARLADALREDPAEQRNLLGELASVARA